LPGAIYSDRPIFNPRDKRLTELHGWVLRELLACVLARCSGVRIRGIVSTGKTIH
jgi:hypothetical protein